MFLSVLKQICCILPFLHFPPSVVYAGVRFISNIIFSKLLVFNWFTRKQRGRLKTKLHLSKVETLEYQKGNDVLKVDRHG